MQDMIMTVGIVIIIIWVILFRKGKKDDMRVKNLNYLGWIGLIVLLIASLIPTKEDYVFTVRNSALTFGIILLIIWTVNYRKTRKTSGIRLTKDVKYAGIVGAVLLCFGSFFPAEKIHHENLRPIPEGYVKVPETQFRSKREVEKEFNSKGLKADFYVQNIDTVAESANQTINEGDCASIEEQKAVRTFSPDQYKASDNNYGDLYAKKGETVRIGYSDHSFKPKAVESSDSKKVSHENKQTDKKESTTKKTSSSYESKGKKLSEKEIINKSDVELEKSFEESLGWATGKLDRDGNPYPDGQEGEPVESFKWALYVNKIEADKDSKGIKIYLNQAGMELPKAEVFDIANDAQSSATATLYDLAGDNKQQTKQIKEFYRFDDQQPRVYAILCADNGQELVRTSAWNNKFKEKDFN